MYNKSVNTSNLCDQEVESPVTYHYASDDFMNVGRQADHDLYDEHTRSRSLSSLSQYAFNDAKFSENYNLDNSYISAQGL